MADINAETLLGALGLARKGASEPFGSVAVALVVGLVVGGVFGLLFAPKSGEETREDLRRQAADAKEDILAVVKKIGESNDATASTRPSES
jgi:gas vesicle protein